MGVLRTGIIILMVIITQGLVEPVSVVYIHFVSL